MRYAIGTLVVASAIVGFSHVVLTQGPTPAKATAQGHAASSAAAGKMTLVQEENVKWGAVPPGFPAGAQFAVLDGDPSKPGLFVVAMKMPDGYTVAPHWHPTDEHVEIISGNFRAGMGDAIDDGKMMTFASGSYANLPKQMHHYAKASGPVEIHVFGMGPFAITYVNPKDDPRKSTH